MTGGVDPGTHGPLPRRDEFRQLVRALLRAVTVHDVAAAVAAHVPPAANSAFANLAVLEPATGRVRVVTFDPVLPIAVRTRWGDVGLDAPAPLCDAIAAREPVLVTGVDDMRERYPYVLADAIGASQVALAALPLVGEGAVLGALTFTWTREQEYGPAQVRLLEGIAQLVADALGRSSQHDAPNGLPDRGREAAAELLQRAVLPAELPRTPELEIAAAYVPADGAAIGGDWYDVFPVADRACLVIGDVAGHGVYGVAAMAQVRNAVRAYAIEDPSPARVMTRVNRLVCELGSGVTASAIVAVWDPSTRELVRANAGHPPVLRCRRGEFAYLEAPAGVVLGAAPGWEYAEATKVLRPGTTLVLYTDGVIEVPPATLDQIMAELLGVVEQLPDLTPQGVCDEIVQWRLGRGSRTDDICVLAARLA